MATGSAQYEHVQSRDNSRMHNGHNYNYTTNNTTFFHVPKKPPKDPIHADLIRACAERARTPRLHHLLSQGADIDHIDELDCTPLHHAVFSGSMETISAVVQAGADVNAGSVWFGTPLCLAAIRRDLAVVTFLIEHSASVKKKCDTIGSAAHAACAGGDLAVIRALYAAGAGFEGSTDICVWPLCHLSQLAQNGSSLEEFRICSWEEYQFQSPGAVAVRFRQCEAVEFCLGLREHLFVHEGWQVVSSLAVRSRSSSLIVTNPGTKISLLSLAMSTLDIRTAESLLNHGAVDSPMDAVGRGALACALDATRLQSNSGADLERCVKLLIRYGININGLQSPNKRQSYDAEHFIARWERFYASGQLLRFPHEILFNLSDRGTTALLYTIYCGDKHLSLVHCVEVLCNNGAQVDVRDEHGRSALDLARAYLTGKKRMEVERILLLHSNMPPVVTEVGPTG